MGRSATAARWATVGGALLVALGTMPAAAQAPSTTIAPTAASPTTTTTTAPASEAALVTVDDEAGYRAALASLSTAPSGPNTLALAADIVVDDGTDPTYTGTAELVIDGNGHTLDGAGANRLLVVAADAPLTLTDLTLRGGRSSGDGGGVLVEGTAQTSLVGVTMTANETSSGNGGALSAVGNVAAESSTFGANAAPRGDGGAVHAASTFPVETSTFVGNSARRGGAVAIAGESAFLDDTFTGNTATVRGGALRATGAERVIVIYVTAAANAAPVAANLDLGGADPDVVATAVADPLGGGNCDPAQPVGRATDSFGDDASCGTEGWAGTDGADALLGPLQDNGGPTETMEPAADSPLVDAIDPVLYWQGPMLACSTYDDQRGVSRPQDGNGSPPTGGATRGPYGPAVDWCDIGAVEREAGPAAPAPVPMAPRFTG